jgi:hypothetical protein
MQDLKVTRFKGLNNMADPLDMGLSWLVTADNINITDAGKIKRRDGYTSAIAGSITGAYGTIDNQRAYYVDAGALKGIDGPTLATGLSSAPMSWAEVNAQVFFSNGVDSGIIQPDNEVRPWSWPFPGTPALAAVTGSLVPGKYDVLCTYLMGDGRETGPGDLASIDIAEGQALQISSIPQAAGMVTRTYIAPANSTAFQLAYEGYQTARVWDYSPNSLGIDFGTNDFEPLPTGCTVIQAWKGRLYAAQYMAHEDVTVIWSSQPLGFHLFDLDADYLTVPGEVLMMAPHADGLVIGTDRRIHALRADKTISELASYAVVPGWSWAIDYADKAKPLYIWSERGMCQALPFVDLTEGHVSVAPGVQAGAAVIEQGGQRRFVASLHAGGSAFNKRN